MAEQKTKVQVKSKSVEEKKSVKAKKAVEAEVKISKEEAVAKPEVKETVKAQVVKKTGGLTIDVYGVDGKVSGKMTLSEEMFGEKVNKQLLAQAVRVYLANQRQGNASTKTRGEVDGSTRKIYRQKGTGRARHGSVRAPIFVKGGIVFGPKPRDFGLSLPKKMKRKALFCALSAKLLDGEVKVVAGLEGLTPKTKQFVTTLNSLGLSGKKQRLLFIVSDTAVDLKRAGKNVPGVSFSGVKRLNVYEVLNNKQVVLPKDTILDMEKYFLAKE